MAMFRSVHFIGMVLFRVRVDARVVLLWNVCLSITNGLCCYMGSFFFPTKINYVFIGWGWTYHWKLEST